MLVLFASLNAVDGICCPDDCTHEQQSASQQHGPQPSDGSCLGAVTSTALHALATCGVVSSSVGLPPFRSPLQAPSDPFEPPPRS